MELVEDVLYGGHGHRRQRGRTQLARMQIYFGLIPAVSVEFDSLRDRLRLFLWLH